ncbi:Wdr65 [Symbiodinium sp. KB8]|nr:Wdr65 [Symbiodinium sp. KB8]
MPGEKATMWNMSTSTEESSLVILSYEEHEPEVPRLLGNGASAEPDGQVGAAYVPDFPGRPRGDWAVPGLSAVFQQANAQASFGRFGLQAMEELP